MFVSLFRGQQFTCPGQKRVEDKEGPFPLCEGASTGEERTGFVFGGETRGAVYNGDQLAGEIGATLSAAGTMVGPPDAFGVGELRFFSFLCVVNDPSCGNRAGFVYSMNTAGAAGEGRVFYIVLLEEWKHQQPVLIAFQSGGPKFRPYQETLLQAGGPLRGGPAYWLAAGDQAEPVVWVRPAQ